MPQALALECDNHYTHFYSYHPYSVLPYWMTMSHTAILDDVTKKYLNARSYYSRAATISLAEAIPVASI